MIQLKVNKPAEKIEGEIKSVESIDGRFGQEIEIIWDIWDNGDYPSRFVESYGVGSDKYGEIVFERLAKFYSMFTGETLTRDGSLDPLKLIGKKAHLTFTEKNGKKYISSRKLIQDEIDDVIMF